MTAKDALVNFLTSVSTSESKIGILVQRWREKNFFSQGRQTPWLVDIENALDHVRNTTTSSGTSIEEGLQTKLTTALNSDGITRGCRWWLLSETIHRTKAADGQTTTTDDPNYALVRSAILQRDLELAFICRTQMSVNPECLTCDPSDTAWWRSARGFLTQDQTLDSVSLFATAANYGALAFIRDAVELLQNRLQQRSGQHFQKSLHSILYLSNPAGRRALKMAILGARCEIVELLLEADPDLADNLTLKYLVENVPELPQTQKLALVKSFVKKLEDIKEPSFWNCPLLWAIEKGDVETTIEISNISDDVLLPEHAKGIVECDGFADRWQEVESKVRPFVEERGLLSLAIEKCRLPIVKSLVKSHPHLLFMEDPSGVHPLCWNLREDNVDLRKAIRELMVAEIISKSHDHQKGTLQIRHLLSTCQQSVKDICLNLSKFEVQGQSFEKFATMLQQEGSNTPQQFETTLVHATFPDLDRHNNVPRWISSDPHEVDTLLHWLKTPRDPREVENILRWLKVKEVKKIVELKILDDWDYPHDEELIAPFLKTFQVEQLDWRRKDVSIPGLVRPFLNSNGTWESPPLRVLHLHSSGLSVALDQWLNPWTFERLPQDRISEQREAKLQQRLEEGATLWENEARRKGRTPGVSHPSWPFPVLEIRQSSWGKSPAKGAGIALPHITTPQIPALSHFLEGYMGLNWTDKNGEALRSIKVAIIDNGVIALNSIPQNGPIDLTSTPNTSPSFKLLKHLKKGRHTSFFHPDGSESPWWHADDPHGTQMANLIAAIDPRCALYIARVCSRVEANDIRIEQVIKAINWARDQNVDIISMSFALYEVPENRPDARDLMDGLRKAVADAHTNNILMICSTADDGRNQDYSYPAKYDETIGIAACNAYGTLLKNATETDARYYVPGKNVNAGVVPFLSSDPEVSGSSAATAIAAGLASLTLSCHLFTGTAEFGRTQWRRDAVVKRFDDMKPRDAADGSRYIRLSQFCGRRSMTGARVNVETLIKDSFSLVT